MQRKDAPESNKSHAARLLPVFDSRKRKIRGLWQRGNRYYAQLRMEIGNGQSKPGRIPLEASTLDHARAELEKTRTRNREGKLPSTGAPPDVLRRRRRLSRQPDSRSKKRSTRNSERVILEYWKAHLGGIRLDKITDVMVKTYREKRLAQGVTARTVNKETLAFYQCSSSPPTVD